MTGRLRADLMGASPDDDVLDPMGGTPDDDRRMLTDVALLRGPYVTSHGRR